jgi:hypothetical protein
MADSKQAAMAAPAFKNGLFLAGEILSLTPTGLVLKTVNKTQRRGSDEIKEYVEQHPVIIDPELVASKGFEVGSRVQFYGLIKAVEGGKIRRVHAFGQTLAKAGEADANIAEVKGIIGTTTYTPADPILRKQGFGRSFVNTVPVGARSVPIVMFQQMGAIWEKVPSGSEVVIGGRVRSQARGGYVDANGDLNIFTEIVADPTKSRVIKRAVVVNALADVDFAAMEAAETGAPAPEVKAEPASPKKSGKKAAAKAQLGDDNIQF